MPEQRFSNRRDAGAKLAEKLLPYAGRSDVVVIALPRGGVPVAYEVAVALRAPLDVFEVRSAARRPLERARWRRARSDLQGVLEGRVDVEALLERRRRASALQRRVPGVETRVSMDNEASRAFTVVDVRAEDRLGLLHEVAACFARAGLEIALAKVATEGNRAIDSFYVAQAGDKLESPAALEALRAHLEAVLGDARGTQAILPGEQQPTE